ncbi:MAG TPA: hypothetical protein VL084_04100 [Thermoanaerobaculia bacterium]|nr:hypothetical protein [Thermoanaerobaculia bacterium]
MIKGIGRLAKLVAATALICLWPHWAAARTPPGVSTSGIPTKGTCGFLLTMRYPFAYLYGADPGPGWGMDALGVIDFKAKTIGINFVLQDPYPVPSTEYQAQALDLPFTTSPGPVPGSFTITFYPYPDVTFGLNLLPVNGGTSFLMQNFNPTPDAQGGSATGTCQMQ